MGAAWEKLAFSGPRFLFFGGKGGVGKTTVAAATALWFADHGVSTTIVSTDPTVSLGAILGHPVAGTPTPVAHIPHLKAATIAPETAKGHFQERLTGTLAHMTGALGRDFFDTPCIEEMAAFDQFVSFLDSPDRDIVIFDTAPTGKTLRELAMPFNWAAYMQKRILAGKALVKLLSLGSQAFEKLEKDRLRYERAMAILADPATTLFSLVLLPERLPIAETESAIEGLKKLGIGVQALIVNQCLSPDIIDGNAFLASRAAMQATRWEDIQQRFQDDRLIERLPLLAHDVGDVAALRRVGSVLFEGG